MLGPGPNSRRAGGRRGEYEGIIPSVARDRLDRMKAARIHQHGGPEVLKYEDVPDPQIKPNQILVRVRACALNHLDLFVRAGIPGLKIPMPHILGSDIAGEVVAVGELCERVQPGWRVLLSPGLSCRQCAQCVSGLDNYCR